MLLWCASFAGAVCDLGETQETSMWRHRVLPARYLIGLDGSSTQYDTAIAVKVAPFGRHLFSSVPVQAILQCAPRVTMHGLSFGPSMAMQRHPGRDECAEEF